VARVQLTDLVVNTGTGNALAGADGASVTVRKRGTTTAVTLYQAATGTSTWTQPIRTVAGQLQPPSVTGDIWVEEQQIDLSITPAAGGAAVTRRVEAVTPNQHIRVPAGATRAEIAAIITELSPAPSQTVGYTLALGHGDYPLDGTRLVVPSWVNLVGAGKRQATRFVCTAAGAGIDFISRGGMTGNFTIDANSVGTSPFRTTGVQRTFQDIDLRGVGATEVCVISNAQNCIFQSVDVQDGALGIVLEEGAKNCLFLRNEIDNQTVAGIKTRQTLAQGAAHPWDTTGTILAPEPDNNLFIKAIIERTGAAATAALYHTAGTLELYDCEIAVSQAIPLILMDMLGTATVCNLRLDKSRITANGTAGGYGIQTNGTVAKFYSIEIDGGAIRRLGTAYRPNDNTFINVLGYVDYTSVTTMYASNGGTKTMAQQVRHNGKHPLDIQVAATTDAAFYTRSNANTGYGPSLRADRFLVGNATTFTEASIPAIISGSGNPEGAISAPIGSEFHRIDGAAGTAIYTKESGTGVSGWVADRLIGTATFDPASLATQTETTTQTVTVTGAALGDQVDASFSLDLQGVDIKAWVSAANTVSYRFRNTTTGTIDLASGTVTARVRK